MSLFDFQILLASSPFLILLCLFIHCNIQFCMPWAFSLHACLSPLFSLLLMLYVGGICIHGSNMVSVANVQNQFF